MTIQEVFPSRGLLPKEETQALSFVRLNPEFNGKGTVVAVLDTGVDPGAPGLQKTPDGRPKIIDILDCSGSGDLNLSEWTAVKLSKVDGISDPVPTVTGSTGRQLILDPSWATTDTKVKLGHKRAPDLFPDDLLERLEKTRREKFELKHSALLTEIQAKLAALPEQVPESSNKEKDPNTEPSNGEKTRADLQKQVEWLKSALSEYQDPFPVIDVVVFHDGSNYRAVLDADGTGDLRKCPSLASFHIAQEYHALDPDSMLNYSVTIEEPADKMTICTVAGSHGTHVAAIIAANRQDDPDLNGVAPGAQIISLKIGDTRLGSIETIASMSRAASYLVKRHGIVQPVDLANISYGEPGSTPNFGKAVEIMRDEAINKYGVTICSSAGNSGPALSTVGAPGGTTSGIIGVGAHVSHLQMKAEYALLEDVPEREYTWSSRGPTGDGDVGVDIYAPGSAVTSVPPYELQEMQLMNGTSMSSPNLCGCLALLVSAWKSTYPKQKLNAYRITRAIQGSAIPVATDVFRTGYVQVQYAWKYLQEYKDDPDQDIFFSITVSDDRQAKGRGIYLREPSVTQQVYQADVSVTPTFQRPIDDSGVEKYHKNQLAYEGRLALVATKPWIRCPDYLLLNAGARHFMVRVDPTCLSAGFHYGEIQAFDTTSQRGSSGLEKGPVFKIPVTVCKPERVDPQGTISFSGLSFGPGRIERKFIAVPQEATTAELWIKSYSTSNRPTPPARFMIQAVQLEPEARFDKYQKVLVRRIGDEPECQGANTGQSQTWRVYDPIRFRVSGGRTMELCIGQLWSSISTHNLSVEVVFHGLAVFGGQQQLATNYACPPLLMITPGEGVARVDLTSGIGTRDKVSLNVSFDRVRKFLKPYQSKIAPLCGISDSLPDGRVMNELILTYYVKLDQAPTTVKLKVPHTQAVLHDSPWGGFLLQMFDAGKKLVTTQDVYPKAIKIDRKGDYTVRVSLRHDDVTLLERMKQTVLTMMVTLKSKVCPKLHSSLACATAGTSKKPSWVPVTIQQSQRVPVYISFLEEQLNQGGSGDFLVGSIDLTVGGKRLLPGEQLLYVVQAPLPTKSAAKPSSSSSGATDKSKKEVDGANEGDRDEESSSDSTSGEISALNEDSVHQVPAQSSSSPAAGETGKSKFGGEEPGDAKSTSEEDRGKELSVAIRDAKIAHLKKYKEVRTALLKDLMMEMPDDEVVLGTQLDCADEPEAIVAAADAVIAKLGDAELAANLALKPSPGLQKRRTQLVHALSKKLQAMIKMSPDDPESEKVFREYHRWTFLGKTLDGHSKASAITPPLLTTPETVPDINYLRVYVTLQYAKGFYGNALVAIDRYAREVSYSAQNIHDMQEAQRMKIETLKRLGWGVWRDHEQTWKLIRFPAKFPVV